VHIRQHPSADDERRVWLSSDERRRLVSATDSPDREVAVRLGLHGLRAKEILAVEPDNIHPIDGSDELRWLQVDAKDTDRDRRRDAPLRRDLAQALRFGGGSIDVTTTKTLRRWVEAAANSVRDETGDERWRWLTPHDLRSTATHGSAPPTTARAMSNLLPDALDDWRVDFLLGAISLTVAVAGAAFSVFDPVLTALQGVAAGAFLTVGAFTLLSEPTPTPTES